MRLFCWGGLSIYNLPENKNKDEKHDANEAFADSDEHNIAASKIIADGKAKSKEVKDSEESMDDLLKRLRS